MSLGISSTGAHDLKRWGFFLRGYCACERIAEQGYFKAEDRVAVVGDGKLGLLIAQAVVTHGVRSLTIFGRHSGKMELVDGAIRVIASPSAERLYAKAFDVCIDATGRWPGRCP
jgi:threonine dehydrogenase-like Zn-dependent dehydrogenase